MTVNQKIAELVVNRRNELALSQEELGERMHMTRVTVSNIENARHELLAKTVFDLALALEIPASEIAKLYYESYYNILKKNLASERI